MEIHPSAYRYVITFGPYAGQTYGYLYENHKWYLEKIAGEIGVPPSVMLAAASTLMGKSIDEMNLATEEKIQSSLSKVGSITKPEMFYVEKGDKAGVRLPNGSTFKRKLEAAIDGCYFAYDEMSCMFPATQIVRAIDVLGGPKAVKADKTVIARYGQEVIRRRELDSIRKKKKSKLASIIPTKLPLWDYQTVAVEFGMAAGLRFIDGDQMGLGKSVTAIGIAELKQAKTLVVCPKNLVRTIWEDEIRKFAGKSVCIWDTSKGPIGDLSSQYHIIHYDVVKKYVHDLVAQKFDLLVCDEATYLKNYQAIRTKSVLGSWKERSVYPGIKTKWVVFLTGTPLLTKPRTLFTLLHHIDRRRFSDVRHFIQRYEGDDPFNPQPQNLDELHDRTKDVMIRRLTKDIRKDAIKFPPSNLFVEMTPEQEREYLAFELKFFQKHNVKNGISAAHMPELRNFLFNYKFPRIIEWTEAMLESERKLVIWTIQVSHAEQIAAHFGEKARIIHGGINQKVRDKSIRDAREGKVDVMVLTLGTSAFGIDGLQNHFDASLFVDEWFVPGINEQAEDRLNRPGQKNPVQNWYMQVRNTYDEDHRDSVDEVRKQIDVAVDGAVADKLRSTNIFAQAIKRRAFKRGLELKALASNDAFLDD